MASLKEEYAKKKQQKQQQHPKNPELFNLSVKYYEQGNFQLAIVTLTQFIELNPSSAEAYSNRGICYRELKNYELALADYNKAIKLNPRYSIAYYNRGNSYQELENHELALADCSKAIELNSRDSIAYCCRGNSYQELENHELALTDYNKAIELNPRYAMAYCCRGVSYHKLKNDELALADFDKAIKLNPRYAMAYYNRGLCYYELKNYELALANYNKAIELNPSFVIAYDNRGACYNDLKNYELAFADYNKAIELNPRSFVTYVNRGVGYYELKNYELALADYSEAIKLSNLSENKKQLCFLASNVAVIAKEYIKAIAYIEQAFELADSKEQQYKTIYLKNIEIAEELDIKNHELEEKNKQLQAKELELEDMMSMFAHKFRSPLDAIIYNTTHDKDTKLYTESANTMRGLLDIFSIISADDKILTDKIKNDSKGNATLMSVLNKNLNMTLLHLLSVSGMSKIHQHYMNYAKAQGKITDAVSYKEWCYDYFEMEGTLQKQWEQEFSALLNNNASLAERLQWLERYFFKLDIIGFEIESIQFKEYETTESFLFILMNEILVNAFKYYASESKQAVILEWTATENDQILSCRNPSIRSERDQHKGSGKGHTFLSALARKTGCKFTKPKPQDDFLLEFAIPNQLLLSNSGAEK